MSNHDVVFNTKDLSEETIQRMIIAMTYSPPSERLMNKLVDVFSVRKHMKANPGLNPDSDEFIETLPEMPKLIIKLYDRVNLRAIKVNKRWAADSMATPAKMPPKRYRRV